MHERGVAYRDLKVNAILSPKLLYAVVGMLRARIKLQVVEHSIHVCELLPVEFEVPNTDLEFEVPTRFTDLACSVLTSLAVSMSEEQLLRSYCLDTFGRPSATRLAVRTRHHE